MHPERHGQGIDMLKGPLTANLIRFAIPVILTAMLEQLFNSADTFILGRFVGTEAMAAVGNSTPIISVIVNLFLGLSLGANVVIAYAIGAKERKTVVRATHTAFLFSFLVGILIAGLGEWLTIPLLSLLDVPASVLSDAEKYLRIYLLAMPFLSAYNFASAILRSNGDTKTPLYALIIASLVNLVLDLLSVTTLGLGIDGVAYATVLSYVLCALLPVRRLTKTRGILHLDFRLLAIHPRELRRIFVIGFPAAVQGMVFCLANVCIQAGINSLGAEAMAASAAAFTVEINLYCIILGFTQTTTTFVSQNFGARKIRRCRTVIRKVILITVCSTIATGTVVFFIRDWLMTFFTSDPAVIAYGATRMLYVVVPQILCIGYDVLSSALRGYGVSTQPALLTLVSICGTRLTWLWFVFPHYPTFATLMVIYPISWICASLLIGGLYYIHLKHMPEMMRGLG